MEGSPLEDADLVERARRGDTRSYEEIVRRYEQVAYRAAYLLLGSTADAEDVARDAFVNGFRALGQYRKGEPLRRWLLQLVASEARKRQRSPAQRAHLLLRASPETHGSDAAEPPEGATGARARRERLLDAIDGLGDDDHDLIACRYLLGLSEEETAAVLAVAEDTVRSRLPRALERLRLRVEVARE